VIQDDTDRLLAGQALDLSSYDMRGTWRQPELLAEQTNACPEFPLDALPGWLSRYCASVSEVVQTPHDLAGLLGLSVLAVASAKRCRVRGRRDGSQREKEPGLLQDDRPHPSV
jgi:hypothetical protein